MARLQSLDSSSLSGASYDPDRRTLTIEFRHGGAYRYFQVSKRTYESLLRAESKGRFFTQRIRNRYAFEKVS